MMGIVAPGSAPITPPPAPADDGGASLPNRSPNPYGSLADVARSYAGLQSSQGGYQALRGMSPSPRSLLE